MVVKANRLSFASISEVQYGGAGPLTNNEIRYVKALEQAARKNTGTFVQQAPAEHTLSF